MIRVAFMTQKTRTCVELCVESQTAFCQTQYYHSFLDNAYDPPFQTENRVSESDQFRSFSLARSDSHSLNRWNSFL